MNMMDSNEQFAVWNQRVEKTDEHGKHNAQCTDLVLKCPSAPALSHQKSHSNVCHVKSET